NILCGNSLISPDFYDTDQAPLFDLDERLTINAFDWEDPQYGFGEIMKAGGFDAVIGNPPYVFARDHGFTDSEKEYYYRKFKLVQYQLNTYIMFFETAIRLKNQHGIVGFITPNNWMTIDTTSTFREYILTKAKNITLVNSYEKVFKGANVDTSILIFSTAGDDILHTLKLQNHEYTDVKTVVPSAFLSKNGSVINFQYLQNEAASRVCRKMDELGMELSQICDVKAGIKAYEVGKGRPSQTEKMKVNRVYHSQKKVDESWLKYLDGVDVARYLQGWSGQYVKYGIHLAAPRKAFLFEGSRLLVRQIPAKPPHSIHAVYVDEVCVNDLNSMIVRKKENDYSLLYILGLLNSSLLSFWFNLTYGKLQRGIFPQFKIKELCQFPIRPIDFSNRSDVAMHDKIVRRVEQILSLNRRLQTETFTKPREREMLEREVFSLDRQIDTLVYDLYALTPEERKLIES
ncbi:MAG: TaqI-like C-terminal specificity domain-containing protein, partial [Planctomycetia bacterium]|nr:TaqI-like C-terminal specificity domain-containing protein [Planctomycetia bacterium]